MNVKRLGVYYAFWLPIAAVIIALEVAWRWTLLRALNKQSAMMCAQPSDPWKDGKLWYCQRIKGHGGRHVAASESGVGSW